MKLLERHDPQARVYMYIKDPVYGGCVRKFVEILGFRSVTTNLTMSGTGTATITFPNFKGCLIKYVADSDVRHVETTGKGKETYNSYAKEFISKLCRDNTETYFRNLWNDTVVMRVNSMTSLGADASDFLVRGRTRGDTEDPPYNSASEIKGHEVSKKDVCIYAFPFMTLFDTIFVDYMGQDGFWYAGFTGVITGINENYPKTGDQAITIQCSDMNVLLDNSTLVVSWFNLPEFQTTIRDFVYSLEENAHSNEKAAYQDIFGKYTKVVDVIRDVIKQAQNLWYFPDNLDLGTKGLYIDPEPKPYYGVSARRGCISKAGDVTAIKPSLYTSSFDLYATDYISRPSDKNGGSRKILVDPLIMKFDNLFIQRLLANNLALFNDLLKSPNNILDELTSRMIAYKYFDAHGNLIIELPRPNNYPNLKDYGGRSIVTTIRHTSSADNKKVNPKNVETLTAPEDAVDYDWLALNFHGKNYVLSQDDFIGFTSQIAEAPLFTVVATDASFDYGISTTSLQVSSLHSVGVANFDLLSKLGVKRYQAQSLYNTVWPSEEIGSKILAHQSVAVLERINSMADSGTIQLNHRPELQLGRTIINPLRMKSYLITGITNTWSPGGMHTTTLTLAYGRSLHKTLETPWHAIFAEGGVFGFPTTTDNMGRVVINEGLISTDPKVKLRARLDQGYEG